MSHSDLHKKTVTELRNLARRLGVQGRSTMTKQRLIATIAALLPDEQKAASNAKVPVTSRVEVKRSVGARERLRKTPKAPLKRLQNTATSSVNTPVKPRRVEPFVDRGLPVPEFYGQDVVVAMPRDPLHIFIYWEVSGSKTHRLLKQFEPTRWVLLLNDLNAKETREVRISLDDKNHYLRVEPEGRYQVSIGYYDKAGRLHIVAKSKIVRTPAQGPSPYADEDEEWMIVDKHFKKLMDMAGGAGAGVRLGGASETVGRSKKIKREAAVRFDLPSSGKWLSSSAMPTSGKKKS